MDSSGSAHVAAFMVAGFIFMGATGAVLLGAQQTAADVDSFATTVSRAEADALASLIVETPGLGWGAGADGVTRLGLQAANGTGLDLDKMDALRGAMFTADGSNGKLDYDEALASLGLDSGDTRTKFHVRIYPVSLETAVQTMDLSNIRTAYIGDWDSLASVTVSYSLQDSVMVTEANTKLNLTMGNGTLSERDGLASLGLGFSNRVHMTTGYPDVLVDVPPLTLPLTDYVNLTLMEGDVYPDDKTYLTNAFAPRMDEYDLIVVGSEVDQSSLTPNAIKSGFEDFVMNGGDLMVMGSNNQNFQWLQPLFAVGTSTANGAAMAPDVQHAMLREPYQLDWTSYDSQGITWAIKQSGNDAHYDDFEHIITDSADADEDILAVSKDGAFGTGRIFLTSYMPKQIATDLSTTEANAFMHNMVVYADRDHLFLDYGPTVPSDAPVSASVHQTEAWDSKLGHVTMRVEVLAWRE